MKFAVFGTGGVGGYPGARLAATGHEVHLIAREEHPTKELAETFEISQQALSKRFRRGHRALGENAFTGTPPEDE